MQRKQRDGAKSEMKKAEIGEGTEGEEREEGEGVISWVGWKSKHFVEK